jgi:hypothetical protein
MSYLIVPTRASQSGASVWIGAIDEGALPTLSVDGAPVPQPAWQSLAGGRHKLVYARVNVPNLDPGRRYHLRLDAAGRLMAVGSVTTLPAGLPGAAEPPFSVLLGSCFHVLNDKQGAAGGTFARTPPPNIKILCGDQVYLDAPWSHFLIHTHSKAEMEARFFETYQRTWEQTGPASGFRTLLQDGANYTTADDHEYWNNAPTAAAYARDTWMDGNRKNWWDAGSALYAAFQNDRAVDQLQVGNLSFFIADTRRNRDTGRARFMLDADLEALTAWIRGLTGPGVLVVGQPVFSGKSGFMGRFQDWSMPDFTDQYARLARALYDATHSVLLLTGDVHFGRVAHCDLPASRQGTPVKLVEIISSPMSLVDAKVGGSWSKAPDTFPAPGIVNNLGRLTVRTEMGFQMKTNHFLTLEFWGVASGVHVAVRSWPIGQGAGPAGAVVYRETLY